VAAERLLLPAGYALGEEDLDLDGQRELIWSSPQARLFLKPRGGRVRELDYLPRAFPLTNVLSRREELYHEQLRALAAAPAAGQGEAGGARSIHDLVLAKEPGLEAYLGVDPRPRASLEEALYAADAEALPYGGGWFDCATLDFTVAAPATPAGELCPGASAELEPGRPLQIEKRLRWEAEGAALAVAITLRYEGPGRLVATLGSGWNLNLLAPEAPDRRVLVDGRPAADCRLRSRGWERAERLELRDEWSGVSIALAGAGLAVYREPIETVSLSEAGFERVYQGSWLCIGQAVDLGGGESVTLRYRVELSPPG